MKRRTALKLVATLPILSLLPRHAFAAPGEGAVPARHQYSGKELFLGLFFGQGPVAKLFPELWQSAPPLQAEEKELVEKVVRRIELSNPSFFDNFQKAIYSGDHYTIETTMQNAANLILDALEAEGYPVTDDVTPMFTYPAVAIAVAAIWSFIGFVATAIASIQIRTKVAYWTPQPDVTTNATPLKREMVVQWIVDRIAG